MMKVPLAVVVVLGAPVMAPLVSVSAEIGTTVTHPSFEQENWSVCDQVPVINAIMVAVLWVLMVRHPVPGQLAAPAEVTAPPASSSLPGLERWAYWAWTGSANKSASRIFFM